MAAQETKDGVETTVGDGSTAAVTGVEPDETRPDVSATADVDPATDATEPQAAESHEPTTDAVEPDSPRPDVSATADVDPASGAADASDQQGEESHEPKSDAVEPAAGSEVAESRLPAPGAIETDVEENLVGARSGAPPAEGGEPAGPPPVPTVLEESAPDAVAVESAEDPTDAILVRIERRLDEVARLGERHADHVGSLHADNQRLRAGELATVVGPLLRDAIRVHDDIQRLEASCTPEAADDLGIVRELVVGMLDRWGVRPFQPGVGDLFDAAVHNGLSRVETPDPLDGTVAAVRRCGFRADDGRVWRPADVEVYRHVARTTDALPTDQE